LSLFAFLSSFALLSLSFYSFFPFFVHSRFSVPILILFFFASIHILFPSFSLLPLSFIFILSSFSSSLSFVSTSFHSQFPGNLTNCRSPFPSPFCTFFPFLVYFVYNFSAVIAKPSFFSLLPPLISSFFPSDFSLFPLSFFFLHLSLIFSFLLFFFPFLFIHRSLGNFTVQLITVSPPLFLFRLLVVSLDVFLLCLLTSFFPYLFLSL
jgi:hypothetical protein